LLFKKKNQHWKILCIIKNFEPFLWNIFKTLNDLYFEQQKMRLPFFEKVFRFSKLCLSSCSLSRCPSVRTFDSVIHQDKVLRKAVHSTSAFPPGQSCLLRKDG
jgi:hypothetical protein